MDNNEPELDSLMFMQVVSTYQMLAMTHLGKITDPQSGEVRRNLPLARQSIDLLSMLQRKTVGNLTDEEDRYLMQTLTDLRLNYVDELAAEKSQSEKSGASTDSKASESSDQAGSDDPGEAKDS